MTFVVSRAKAARLIALGLAMVGASVFCATRPGLVPQVAGWVGVVFFGGALVVIVGKLWHRGVALEIDAAGLRDHRSGLSISWRDVRGVTILEIAGTAFLALDIAEVVRAGEQGALSGATATLNGAMGLPPVTVSFQELSPGLDEAWTTIQRLDLPFSAREAE